jgi:hypothetical protein
MVVLLKYSLIKYYVKPNSEICKDINVREYRRGNQKLTIQRNLVRVALLFSCLCCPIVCLYILSSVLWCPLRFPHNTMFCSLLPPVVCRERIYHLRYIVSLRIVVSNTYCDLFLFCFLRLVFPILPVSLDCQFLIAPSVFSNIYILTNLTIRLYIIQHRTQNVKTHNRTTQTTKKKSNTDPSRKPGVNSGAREG